MSVLSWNMIRTTSFQLVVVMSYLHRKLTKELLTNKPSIVTASLVDYLLLIEYGTL